MAAVEDGKTPGQLLFESMQEAAGLLGIADQRQWTDMADTSRAVSEHAARIYAERAAIAPTAAPAADAEATPAVAGGEPTVVGMLDSDGGAWVQLMLEGSDGAAVMVQWPSYFARGYGQVITEAAIGAELEALLYGYVYDGTATPGADGEVPETVEQAAREAATRAVVALRQRRQEQGE